MPEQSKVSSMKPRNWNSKKECSRSFIETSPHNGAVKLPDGNILSEILNFDLMSTVEYF